MGTYSFTHRKIVQGFSIGGEYSGAAIFVAEYSPDRKRGFMGSWLDFGSIAGFVLGAATVALITHAVGEARLPSGVGVFHSFSLYHWA